MKPLLALGVGGLIGGRGKLVHGLHPASDVQVILVVLEHEHFAVCNVCGVDKGGRENNLVANVGLVEGGWVLGQICGGGECGRLRDGVVSRIRALASFNTPSVRGLRSGTEEWRCQAGEQGFGMVNAGMELIKVVWKS